MENAAPVCFDRLWQSLDAAAMVSSVRMPRIGLCAQAGSFEAAHWGAIAFAGGRGRS